MHPEMRFTDPQDHKDFLSGKIARLRDKARDLAGQIAMTGRDLDSKAQGYRVNFGLDDLDSAVQELGLLAATLRLTHSDLRAACIQFATLNADASAD